METYQNEKGEVVVIKEMDASRLIHAIAKYAVIAGDANTPLVKALKAEAFNRLSGNKES